MNKNKLVSVIIPCYNVEKYIEKTLKSVINQSYSNIEIILIDDGSTDNTANIISELAKEDNRIKYYYQNNSGVSYSRNIGIEKSKGEFICFLDGDDLYFENKIKHQLEKITENNVDICCCWNVVTSLDNENKIKSENIYTNKETLVEDFILQKAFITTNDWMIRKKVIVDNELFFEEKYKYGEDFNFFLKILSVGEIIICEEVLTMYRINSNSSSFKITTRINEEDNYIYNYLNWIDTKKNIIFNKSKINNIKKILNNFLLPQVVMRNIEFNKKKYSELTSYEKEIIKSFKPNNRNIKSSIKYLYLKCKMFFRV